jgi:hypothetical protein
MEGNPESKLLSVLGGSALGGNNFKIQIFKPFRFWSFEFVYDLDIRI